MCFSQSFNGAASSTPSATKDWQSVYAVKNWEQNLTVLSDTDEASFQAWAKDNNVPITEDYDMRGFWKSGGETSVNRNDGKIHYTDQYKTPLHESFSGESIYARKDVPTPSWNDKDQLVAPDGTVLFDEPKEVEKRKKNRKGDGA